ncbi:hypothetical protein [Streptomyces sp. NPDC058280]|uniref:hypothetical protein n=1 Tax=Streptomyces sp. NPDC058280 TaxID=3346419 RepID=UPI0036E806BA
MSSNRRIEFTDTEGTRWSRTIGGVLFVFDLVRPFTTLRGEPVPGRLLIDRYDIVMAEWQTVHVLPA